MWERMDGLIIGCQSASIRIPTGHIFFLLPNAKKNALVLRCLTSTDFSGGNERGKSIEEAFKRD